MLQDRHDRVIRLVERLGIATVICGVLLFAGWQVSRWAGVKVIEPMLAEQLGIMAAARIGMEHGTETAATNAASLAKLAACQERQDKTLCRVCRVLERIEASIVMKGRGQPQAHPEPEIQ